ncbi:MAG: cysteine hydrolase [Chloroflexota bacterium]
MAHQPLNDLSSDTGILLRTKGDPIALTIAQTVILVIDMQNDFGTEGGMFERAGIDISMIQKAVPATASVLAAGRKAGIKIIYLKMAFRPDLSDATSPDSPNRITHTRLDIGTVVHAPDGSESRILIRDTWNTDIVSELEPQAGDTVIYKHRFSGFFETDLDAILKAMNVKYLIVTGCTTSVCVESTIRDAMCRDYSCVALEDCIGEPGRKSSSRMRHEASLLLIQRALGWVSTSDAFIRVLKTRPTAAAIR